MELPGSNAVEWEDAFKLLGIDEHASESQIRTAYRKRSLQFHPDKVRDIPPDAAAERFHRLTLAYEALLDPSSRARLLETLENEKARRKRQFAFDDRRKSMAADLERREELDRVQRVKSEQKRREKERRILALREEGRTMRVERHERLLEQWQQSSRTSQSLASTASTLSADGLPPWGPSDTSVLIRFPSEQACSMWGTDIPPHNLVQTPLAEALTLSYGPLSSVHIKSSQKKRREVSVIASFEHGVHAWRAVTEGSDLRCSHNLLQDCWIGWWDPSTGKAATHPPARVQAWIQGGVSARDAPVETRTPHDAADEFDYDYEASTLARLRQVASTMPLHAR